MSASGCIAVSCSFKRLQFTLRTLLSGPTRDSTVRQSIIMRIANRRPGTISLAICGLWVGGVSLAGGPWLRFFDSESLKSMRCPFQSSDQSLHSCKRNTEEIEEEVGKLGVDS